VVLIVEFKGVGFAYGGRSVFRQLDWQVPPGQFHAVLGASGSGKTTLLRLIAGLEFPQVGGVFLSGCDARNVAPHLRSVAMVGQSAAAYDHLSVAENLRFAVALADCKTAGLQEELVSQFGLADSMQQKPGELSGGQLQRLAIVRALLTQRRLLLLDEPLAHLQESLRGPIRRLLRQWQQQRGLTCIYVTHDSQEACEMSDCVSVLGEGGILQCGDARTLYRQPNSKMVAELMGRPAVQWFCDPRSGRSAGARPLDWHLVARYPEMQSNAATLSIDSDSIRVLGRLVSKREVESSRWYEVQAGENVILFVVQGSGLDGVVFSDELSKELQVGSWVEIRNSHPIPIGLQDA